MTGKTTYVDLNVRELFEENTVDNVREVQKKVSHEIERKREELRMLVGESYRDLIDAADTIGVMKSSSMLISNRLEELRLNLKSFPKHLGSRGNALRSLQERKLTPSEMEIAAELKLTLEAPRYVRFHLDQGRIIDALHLYLFSSKVDLRSKPYKWTFLQGLDYNADPVNSIKSNILNFAQSVLRDTEATEQKLTECIMAQQVLAVQSCEVVLQKFLDGQLQNCQNRINDREDFLNVVTFTVRSLHNIFIEPQLYSSVAKQVRKPKISWAGLGFTFTTKSMEQFQNETIEISEPPRVTKLADLVIHSFIQPLKVLLEKNYEAKAYLTEEKSLEEMNEYRKSSTELLRLHCEDLMRIVLGTTKSLWSEVFLNVFHSKCKAVVSSYVTQTIELLLSSAFPRLSKLDSEFDVISFVWTPTPLDEKNATRIDELKLKSVSPYVAEINSELEQKLVALFEDSRKLGDNLVKEYISAQLQEGLDNLLRGLEKSSPGLVLGRWCSTLGEFCPTLWKLLKQNEATKFRVTLLEISESCCSSWTVTVLEKFVRDLESAKLDTDLQQLTKAMAVAEEFTTEGEGTLTPSVRVPLQLSHTLQSRLFGICFEFGRIGPQSIPKNVRDDFRFAVGEKVSQFYNQLDTSQLTPQTALQIIFDLKYVQWFHPKLTSVVEPPLVKLQALIDPFDMDIVSPKLTLNLKRCLFENHLTLGLLFSEESHGFVAQNFKTKGNQTFPPSIPVRHVPLPLLPV
ncbi:unnamed protein product [Allacma fusca]|uniref:Conserved oligomeric Golgi complex subunit 1 n=1 Tax=Allacma fusca TaxID=39272 RepID=A0A8J2LST2_9HEXA|nr:unnamed protein product [Allacma fusca]